MSREELDRIIPVNPPMVNKKINPRDHIIDDDITTRPPCKVPSHLNTLIPVGIAIIIVAIVK